MEPFVLSGKVWEVIMSHIPVKAASKFGGRPPLDSRKVFTGIVFIKTNKLTWRSTDKKAYGSKTTLNDYYRNWAQRGVFHALKESKVLGHPELIKMNLDWDQLDSLYGQGNTNEK